MMESPIRGKNIISALILFLVLAQPFLGSLNLPLLAQEQKPPKKPLHPTRPVPYVNDGRQVTYFGKVVEGADPNSFKLVTFSYAAYGKDAKHVYLGATVIPGADPGTFAWLGTREYSKDATQVFLGLDTLPHADPKTFVVLKGGFAKDAGQVYYGTSVFIDADPRTFSIIADNQDAKNETIFAKDVAHVFYEGGWGQTMPSIIVGADPYTFVILDHDGYSGGYAEDSRSVYWGDMPVEGTDPNTFQSMAPYGKDAHAVYVEGKRLDGADPATFVFLLETDTGGGLGYAKDAHAVYYEHDRISGADAATFVIVENSDRVDAKDKNHTYLGGQIVN